MAKYLDLTGLSHYDQKIKQYISQHSGGALYAHCINFATPNRDIKVEIITSSATPFTKATLISYLTNNPRFFSGADLTGDFVPIFIYENSIESAYASESVGDITNLYADTVVQI